MDISVSKNKHLIELNNGELVDINELVAKLSKMQNLESDLYEANNRINDLLDIVKQKDELINLMAEEFINKTLMYNDWQKNDLIEYFEERCR